MLFSPFQVPHTTVPFHLCTGNVPRWAGKTPWLPPGASGKHPGECRAHSLLHRGQGLFLFTSHEIKAQLKQSCRPESHLPRDGFGCSRLRYVFFSPDQLLRAFNFTNLRESFPARWGNFFSMDGSAESWLSPGAEWDLGMLSTSANEAKLSRASRMESLSRCALRLCFYSWSVM